MTAEIKQPKSNFIAILKRLFQRLYKFAGSLGLAVFIILSIAAIASWGTIVESRYNAETAQKLVYYSGFMKFTMVLLVINLVVSVLHRYPWKKKHTGFIVTHAGIILILFGSVLTARYGVDGSMFFGIGESSSTVSLTETEVRVYKASDDLRFLPYYTKMIDFLLEPPESNPFEIKLGSDNVKFTRFLPYAVQKTEVEPILPGAGETGFPAVRFQIFNDRVNVTEWLQQNSQMPVSIPLGPAQIVLTTREHAPSGENEFVVQPSGDRALNFFVYSKGNKRFVKKGKIAIGETVDTGWMNLQFRLLNYYPMAKTTTEYQALEKPTPVTTSAVEIEYQGKKQWMGLNSILKFFTDQDAYIIRYGNRTIDLGFKMTLQKFEVGRYQGTMRAASYKSYVDVEGLGAREIYMNEPLKHNGYTLYQASFQEDPQTGQPNASILSVNYDPGRWWKYLGSFMIVLGSLLMFYLGDYFKKPSKAQNLKKAEV